LAIYIVLLAVNRSSLGFGLLVQYAHPVQMTPV
jgi:hypothetical protein